MKVTIIIPVYNEAATIRQVIAAVRRVPLSKEIIVVDGNSTDGTAEILQEENEKQDLNVIFQKDRNGRGGALREGMRVCTGDIVVFQDADLELDPACLPELVQPIVDGQCQFVLGSRFLNRTPQMSFLQYWGNRVVTELINVLWHTRLTDAETCYQVFSRRLTQNMKLDRTDMSFSIELLLRLICTGAPYKEIAVSYFPRTHQEGKKLYWKDGFISLWVVLKYRFLLRKSATCRADV